MELLVRAACAEDEAQEPRNAPRAGVQKGVCPPLRGERRGCELRAGVAAGEAHRVGAHSWIGRETKEALTPEYGDSHPHKLTSRQTTAGLSSTMSSGLFERRSLSTQINNPSPVFGPVTPDDQEDEREKCVMRSGDISGHGEISPLRTNATSACAKHATARPASTSVQHNGQVRTSTTPPLQEQHAAVQRYIASRRESLAAEQPEGTHCVACKTLFSATHANAVVVRPRPGHCEHVFCGGCYEAYAGRRLPEWPCPECERLAVFAPYPMMTGAVPVGRVGVAPTLMPHWAMAGTPHLTMIPRGPMVPTAVATNRPSDRLCSRVPPVRPLVSTSIRPGAADPDPMPTSTVTDNPKNRKSPTRHAVPGLEGAICKRAGSKSGSRRTTWACTQPGCKYIARSSRHMLRHMTTHTGERPFVCNWPGCNYRAKQREHLKTHELKHSDTKSFKCHVCGFATKRKEHLKRHIGRHGANHAGATL